MYVYTRVATGELIRLAAVAETMSIVGPLTSLSCGSDALVLPSSLQCAPAFLSTRLHSLVQVPSGLLPSVRVVTESYLTQEHLAVVGLGCLQGMAVGFIGEANRERRRQPVL